MSESSANAELALGTGVVAARASQRLALLQVKAAVNEWVSANLDGIRTNLALGKPTRTGLGPSRWRVPLVVKQGRTAHRVGEVHLDDQLQVVQPPERDEIERRVRRVQGRQEDQDAPIVRGSTQDFRPGTKFHGNGTVHKVFTYKSPSPQHRIHPTQKPLGLFCG